MQRNEKKLKWIREMNESGVKASQIVYGIGCEIHPSAQLGGDGHSMAVSEKGFWERCKHQGGIVLGDFVHVGEGTVVKRATLYGKNTWIKDDVKLCSFVNVGHNCEIGEHTFVGPHVCFNGSVKVGDNCWIAGHAIIGQHSVIGDNVTIGMGAVVPVRTVIPDNAVYVGVPAKPIKFLDNSIHPSFKYYEPFKIGKYNHIHENVSVGKDCTIRSFVELRPNTTIGDDCYIDSGVKSSGNCLIGHNVTIRYDSIIARDVIIENNVFIAPQVMFINIPFIDKEKKPTIIRHGVKIGTNTTINDGVEICEDAIIGAKSFVNKDISEKGVYVGVPVRRIK
jgi:UDP-3-O-[3-hydroxymyristoyl] glucosamine N-acyltransferase